MKPTHKIRKSKRTQNRAKPISDPLEELVTMEQQRMMEAQASSAVVRRPSGNAHLSCSSIQEEEEAADMSIEEIKKVDAEKMSILVSQLLAKNKINAKNAFEVPLIQLTQTCAFSETSTDNSWKRLSSTLESNNKIYGYRVDAAHNYTYRVLESITRQEKQENQDEDETAYRRQKPEINSLNSQLVNHDSDDIYSRHLEKNFRNINIQHLESFFNVNPMLEKTKRIFDQNGLSSLLLNNLDIRTDLSLRITLIQHTNQKEIINPPEENEILCEMECGNTLEPNNIFKTIQGICMINNLIEAEEEYMVKRETGEIEALWIEFEAQFLSRNRKRWIKLQEEKIKDPIQVESFQSAVDLSMNVQRLLNASISGFDSSAQLSGGAATQSNEPAVELKKQHIEDNHQSPAQFSFSLPSDNHPPNIDISQVQPAEPTNLQCTPKPSDDPQSPSNQCTPSAETNHIQITDYIKMKKLSLSTDLILNEIEDPEKEAEKADIVSKWKNHDQIVRKKRTPRKKNQGQLNEYPINFVSREDGVRLSQKSSILSLDKKMKKQLKQAMKKLGIQPYQEVNCLINTKSWKISMEMQTFLSQCKQTEQQQLHQQQNDSNNDASGMSIIDLDAPSQNKWALLKNCKHVSIRQAKTIIKSLIECSCENEIAFGGIYMYLMSCESYISPALCFLTILHLSNEYNYTLMQKEGQYNFIIIRH